MNIFVLAEDPWVAAKEQCDKHVVKMCLETTQIVSTLSHKIFGEGPYKMTHANHPCTLWAGESAANFLWLSKHGRGLFAEYTNRYGKRHASNDKFEECISRFQRKHFSETVLGLTPFALCMPDEYKTDCPVQSYRNYYIGEKAYMAEWRHSNKPKWFVLDKETANA